MNIPAFIGRTQSVEILKIVREGEWFEAQLAIGGTPSVPFLIHAQDRDRFPTEELWMNYLTRKATEMIEVYGDARFEIPNDPRLDQELSSVAVS